MKRIERRNTVGRRPHVVAVRNQTVPQYARDLRLVIDDQDFLVFAHMSPTGSVRTIFVPLLLSPDWISILPFWASTIPRAIARPRPRPLDWSPPIRTNFSKTF